MEAVLEAREHTSGDVYEQPAVRKRLEFVQSGGALESRGSLQSGGALQNGVLIRLSKGYIVRSLMNSPPSSPVIENIKNLEFTPGEEKLFSDLGLNNKFIRDSIQSSPESKDKFYDFWYNIVTRDMTEGWHLMTGSEANAVKNYLNSVVEKRQKSLRRGALHFLKVEKQVDDKELEFEEEEEKEKEEEKEIKEVQEKGDATPVDAKAEEAETAEAAEASVIAKVEELRKLGPATKIQFQQIKQEFNVYETKSHTWSDPDRAHSEIVPELLASLSKIKALCKQIIEADDKANSLLSDIELNIATIQSSNPEYKDGKVESLKSTIASIRSYAAVIQYCMEIIKKQPTGMRSPLKQDDLNRIRIVLEDTQKLPEQKNKLLEDIESARLVSYRAAAVISKGRSTEASRLAAADASAALKKAERALRQAYGGDDDYEELDVIPTPVGQEEEEENEGNGASTASNNGASNNDSSNEGEETTNNENGSPIAPKAVKPRAAPKRVEIAKAAAAAAAAAAAKAKAERNKRALTRSKKTPRSRVISKRKSRKSRV
jgi:hypothetical protein